MATACICQHQKNQHNYSRDSCAMPGCNCRAFLDAETRARLEAANERLAAALRAQMIWKGEEVGGSVAQETHTCECFLGQMRGADCLDRCQLAVAALSDQGEGNERACPSCGCVLGTNTHCGTCKLNRGGEGRLANAQRRWHETQEGHGPSPDYCDKCLPVREFIAALDRLGGM